MQPGIIRRHRLAVGFVTAALIVLCGVAGVATAGTAADARATAQKNTLVVLEEDIAPALDIDGPSAAHPGTQEIIDNIMAPLVEYQTVLSNGVLVPQYTKPLPGHLAESYSHKGLVWTFKLRHGVKSCAGNEFTADDVIYWFERAISASGSNQLALYNSFAAGILPISAGAPTATADARKLHGEVTKIDDYTVQIKQTVPSELLLPQLALFIFDPWDSKEMKKHATAKDPWSHTYTLTQNSPGFGPYCLAKWTKGSEMTLTANPNYFRGQPKYTKIIIRKVPTIANRIAAIRSGAADITYPLTPVTIADLKKTSNVDVLEWINNNGVSLGLNYKYEPWSLPGGNFLRQAVAYALPYAEIVAQDYKGTAKQWDGLVPSVFYGYKPISTYRTDIAKAKALLAKAGFPGGKGLEKYSAGLTLYITAERSTVIEPIANRIRTALGNIGIPITLSPISLSEIATRELAKYDLPMWIRDQLQSVDTDAAFQAVLFFVSKKNGGLLPSTNYESAPFDKLFAQNQLTTGAKRLAILHKMQDILMADLPMIPIVEFPSSFAVRKGLGPLQGRPNNSVTFWYFK